MAKINLNTHDIYALVTEFQMLIGSNIVNVYDIDTQTICIKLKILNHSNSIKPTESDEFDKNIKPTESNEFDKKHILKYLIIESGVKFYVLDQFKAVNDIPSSFSSKLRKHIKNKRLESIIQINKDRVIDIKFGIDDQIKNFTSAHLICEFYSSGNIILTDNTFKILTLIHTFTYKNLGGEISGKTKVGEVYNPDLTTSKIELTLINLKKFISDEILNINKKIKLKQFFMKLPLIMYSPNVIEHVILSNQLNNIKVDSTILISDILTDDILLNIISNINYLFNLDNFNGYVLENNNVIPYLYKQFENENNIIKYNTFSEALSIHFNKFDSNKFETKEIKKIKLKQNTKSKNDKIITNIQNQIITMTNRVDEHYKKIENIEKNLNRIQIFIDYIVNNNIKNHITFLETIEPNIKLINYECFSNTIKFLFNDIEYNWNTLKSTHANVSLMYDLIKHTNNKITNAQEILDKTMKKIKSDQLTISTTITVVDDDKVDNNKVDSINLLDQTNIKEKKDYWFESFNWFVTSEGLYFVSGKTADQNEILVKKYFNDYDLYFHSDVFGSGSGILKIPIKLNKEDYYNTYAKSLEECGNFLICHTKAWQTNSPDRSYWVFKDQVSKTPESGEYNVKGAFIIRGNKNYVCTSKMELGFGILFKCANTSVDNLKVDCDENIEWAIPIVGTYQSMQSYKFKIKITPGTQRIKKQLPLILNKFSKLANKYELLAIKRITNDHIQRVLISGVKFHL